MSPPHFTPVLSKPLTLCSFDMVVLDTQYCLLVLIAAHTIIYLSPPVTSNDSTPSISSHRLNIRTKPLLLHSPSIPSLPKTDELPNIFTFTARYRERGIPYFECFGVVGWNWASTMMARVQRDQTWEMQDCADHSKSDSYVAVCAVLSLYYILSSTPIYTYL
jgi:hypothetical protein